MRFKKALGILRTKIRLLLMIGVLLAAAAGCQFAGEYLHSHYIREEVSETSGNISEKKTVVIDSGHGGKSGRFKSYEGVALEYAFLIGLAQGTLPGQADV